MDIMCIGCGEPWEVSTFWEVKRAKEGKPAEGDDTFDDLESFELGSSVFTKCPSCEWHEKNTEGGACVSDEKREAVAMLADMLGDDTDGMACSIEDFGLDF